MIRLKDTKGWLLVGLTVGLLTLELAAPARAGFSMDIRANPGSQDGVTITENSNGTLNLSDMGNAANVQVDSYSLVGSTINLKAVVDNYLFQIQTYTNQPAGAGPQGKVSYSASITALAGAAPTNFSFYTSSGPFAFPVGNPSGSMLLQAAVTAGSVFDHSSSLTMFNGLPTNSSFVQTIATMSYNNGASTASTFHTGGVYLPSTPGSPQTSSVQTAVGPPLPTNYTLTNLGGTIVLTGLTTGQKIQFVSQAVTALPEPSGLVLGLLGLPFAGGLAFVGVRRGRRVPAIA